MGRCPLSLLHSYEWIFSYTHHTFRWESKYMHMTFDGEPTADSELHSKLDRAVREELEGLVSILV